MLYFEYGNEMFPKQYQKVTLSDNITKIIANYKSQEKDVVWYAVDFSFLLGFLSQYQLNIPIIKKLQKGFIKILINIVPIKAKRRELRKKYHI